MQKFQFVKRDLSANWGAAPPEVATASRSSRCWLLLPVNSKIVFISLFAVVGFTSFSYSLLSVFIVACQWWSSLSDLSVMIRSFFLEFHRNDLRVTLDSFSRCLGLISYYLIDIGSSYRMGEFMTKLWPCSTGMQLFQTAWQIFLICVRGSSTGSSWSLFSVMILLSIRVNLALIPNDNILLMKSETEWELV